MTSSTNGPELARVIHEALKRQRHYSGIKQYDELVEKDQLHDTNEVKTLLGILTEVAQEENVQPEDLKEILKNGMLGKYSEVKYFGLNAKVLIEWIQSFKMSSVPVRYNAQSLLDLKEFRRRQEGGLND